MFGDLGSGKESSVGIVLGVVESGLAPFEGMIGIIIGVMEGLDLFAEEVWGLEPGRLG